MNTASRRAEYERMRCAMGATGGAAVDSDYLCAAREWRRCGCAVLKTAAAPARVQGGVDGLARHVKELGPLSIVRTFLVCRENSGSSCVRPEKADKGEQQ